MKNTQSPRKEVIQLIYLYIVTMVGLFMIVIPSVDIIKIGLEKWVFPLAVQDDYGYRSYAPEPYMIKDRIILEDNAIRDLKISEEEAVSLERWKVEFEAWEKNEKDKDHVAIQRQRNMVRDISVLLGGLALFLSHGLILRKKRKEN